MENDKRNIGRDPHIAPGVYYIEKKLCARIDGDRIIVEKKESEDERVRKFLLALCVACPENSTDFCGEIKKADVLAWLEKQKDSVSNAKYIDGVAHAFEDGRKKGQEEKQKEQKFLPGFEDLTPEEKMNHPLYLEGFDMGREVQKVFDEQKPVDTTEIAHCINCPVYEKAELSEEDERILKGIIGLIDHNQHYGVGNKEMLAWLNNLRPQPKQEWTDEDEKMLNKFINRLETVSLYTRTDSTSLNFSFFNEIGWLRSLRNRYAWRPTDEQMEALSEAVETFAGYNDYPAIESLYNDLKKLKEE